VAALEQSHFDDDPLSQPMPAMDYDRDASSLEGAHRLKQRIEAYWRERGYAVLVEVPQVGFIPAMRRAPYAVRSDMLNGLPRHPLPASEQANG